MKNIRRLLFAAFLGCFVPLLSYAQGVFVPPRTVMGTVNGFTRPLTGATVTVCAANSPGIPCSPALANTVFKDSGLTVPLANPFTTDANGNYPQAALGSGIYTITESAVGFAGFSYQATVACAPGTGCSIAGPFAFTGAVTAQKFQSTFWVDGFPAGGCTVNSVVYTTQLDCAYYTALLFAQANQVSPVLHLGNGIYTTCAGLLEDTNGTGVSIIGEGSAEQNGFVSFTQNNGTVIRLTCGIGTHFVVELPTTTVHFRYNLHYRGFTVDANNQTTAGCFWFASAARLEIERLSCSNVPATATQWMKIGDHTSALGQVFETLIEHIELSGRGTSISNFAAVTANVVAGNIATNGYTVTNAGTGYFNTGTIKAYLVGYGSALSSDQPCTTMPTNLTATVTGTSGSATVSSVQSTVGASGCSGTVFVVVPDAQQNTYGVLFDYMTDSTIIDMVVRNMGTTADFECANQCADNTFIHIHPYPGAPIGIQDFGNLNSYFGTELDQFGIWGFDLQGQNGFISGTTEVPAAAGSAAFHWANGVSNAGVGWTIHGHSIVEKVTEPTGWHRYIVNGQGVVDTTRWNNGTTDPITAGLLPAGTTIQGTMHSAFHPEVNFSVSGETPSFKQFNTFTGIGLTAHSFFQAVMELDNGNDLIIYSGNGTGEVARLKGTNGLHTGSQFIGTTGSVCTNGELALSAGWQSTGSATVTGVAGNGQTCSWTITTGTTTAANPTVTDTLTNALPVATTRCWMFLEYGPASTHTAAAGEGFAQTTLSATAPVFTFNGTPTAAGKTYLVVRTCGP